jgi:hypothetical protein
MIPNSPSSNRTKFSQITQFLETPVPQSLLEPGPGRDCDTHRVSAQRQNDGTFVLFARKPSPDSGTTVPVGDLDAFLNAMVQEVKDSRGDDVAEAADELFRSIARWNHYDQAPTVAELRTRIGRLSAPLPSDLQLRSRAMFRLQHFQRALQKSLDALPEHDPQRDALKKAVDPLANMLVEPSDTLSLEGLSHDAIGLLLDTGLLACFAELRDGVKPVPKRLVLPVSAQPLLPRLPQVFPAMTSWIVR